jgi:putative transcriptional regulator
MDPAAGRLLIATPSLVDPNFARSIVLLVDQGDEGALGVVLNRPLEVEVGRVLDGWDRLVDRPDVLFGGGPVQTEVALALARVNAEQEPMGWRRVDGELGLLDLDAPVELLEQALSSLRIFAGYAGWSAGQLEAEIAEGSWIVVPAEPQDPFLGDPALLWGQVLRRQGGRLAMLATQPRDPASN